MKTYFNLMPIIVIMSIFSISQAYAQSSSSDNTLRACVDVYMEKFDQAVAKLDENLQKHKDRLTETSEENNATFLKRISTEACVSSYTQTGKFGHLLSAQDQEKFVTAAFFKLMMETKNKMNK